MLTALSIDNYALIEHLDVSFDTGMTTITGETGAGKSILLGALSLVLGKRADRSALKDSAKKCIIEAHFDIASYGLQYIYNNFIFSPSYSATFKSYNESGTLHEVNGREDLIHSLNVRVDYPINDHVNLGLFGGYSKRDTKDSGSLPYDFVKGSFGLALGLNTTF